MELTDVRIVPMYDRTERLVAICNIVIDNALAVRDIRLYKGKKGDILCEFPAQDYMDRCPKCRRQNSIRVFYCTWCGIQLGKDRIAKDPKTGRKLIDYDIAHPLDSKTRDMITKKIIEEYHKKMSAPATPPQQETSKTK